MPSLPFYMSFVMIEILPLRIILQHFIKFPPQYSSSDHSIFLDQLIRKIGKLSFLLASRLCVILKFPLSAASVPFLSMQNIQEVRKLLVLVCSCSNIQHIQYTIQSMYQGTIVRIKGCLFGTYVLIFACHTIPSGKSG